MTTLNQATALSPFSPIHLDNFETKELISSTTGQAYQVRVQLPPSYKITDQTYPVLYALDTEFLFGMQTQVPFVLNFGEVVPEFIIVGPAYGVSTLEELLATRERDYTPTADPAFPGSGGGADFLRFLEADLFPFVESTYRTQQKERTLWGYSYGGLFALYALFTKPELFQHYIATSPSVWWDDEVIFAFEERYASRHRRLPARLFTSLGALEPEDLYKKPWSKLLDVLRKRAYEGFEMKPALMEGHGHYSVFAQSYVDGLMALFGTGTGRTDRHKLF